MRLSARPLGLVVVCVVALACTACGSNSKKIVGKWKMVSMTAKDGNEQKMEFMGMTPILEFTADGNLKAGMDMSNMPAELRQKIESNKESAAKMSETKQVGKYKISGSNIEFKEMEGSGETPIGKKQGGKLSFDGDNLTITSEDGTLRLTRLK